NVFPTQIEEQLMATGGLAPHFQIELYKSGRMDAMRVFVEAEPGATDNLSKTASARMLTKRVKDIVGVSCEVVVGDPGEVARSEGKAKRVVDNRNS
ncbi:MAG: phenylacetate--CoA ligase, partial [Halocynthiibacter sp.]